MKNVIIQEFNKEKLTGESRPPLSSLEANDLPMSSAAIYNVEILSPSSTPAAGSGVFYDFLLTLLLQKLRRVLYLLEDFKTN